MGATSPGNTTSWSWPAITAWDFSDIYSSADLAGEEYATSGNQGILDIAAALKWVHENIEAFGGDPHNVMVFGESGGGAKTSCIYALPLAKDYFNKASIESGPGVHMTPRDMATETARMVLTELGLSEKEVAKLKDVPAEKLVEVQGAVAKKAPGNLTLSGGRKGMVVARPGGFGPVVDGTYLPHDPFDPTAPSISRDKPLMVGTNRDEMAFFYWERKATDLFTLTDDGLEGRNWTRTSARMPRRFWRRIARAGPALLRRISTLRLPPPAPCGSAPLKSPRRSSRRRRAPVYHVHVHSRIELDGPRHEPSPGRGSRHGDLVQVQQRRWSRQDPGRPSLIGTDPDRKQAALNMSEMWATFARTGHPGAKGQPSWPAYTPQKRATMMIDTQCKVEENPFGQELALWDSLKT